jgi:hypothetical protein
MADTSSKDSERFHHYFDKVYRPEFATRLTANEQLVYRGILSLIIYDRQDPLYVTDQRLTEKYVERLSKTEVNRAIIKLQSLQLIIVGFDRQWKSAERREIRLPQS